MPLPVPLTHWFAEWGVDPQAVQNGGLITPVEATPFRQIYLLQRKASKLGAGLGKTSGWVHRATLQRNKVEMLAGVEYQRIDDAGLHISINGATRVLEVDNVILCAGQDSLTELMPEHPTEKGPRFHKIGGAALASELDAKRAIREGAVLGASL
jgi:2,4-dienoyl-CoA reductase (NADPH2)